MIGKSLGELLEECGRYLDEQNVPSEGRYIKIHKSWLRPQPRSKKRRIQKKWLTNPFRRRL